MLRKLPVITTGLGVFILLNLRAGLSYTNATQVYFSSTGTGSLSLDASTKFSANVASYMPIILKSPENIFLSSEYRVNVPHFEDEVRFSETGIFWLGKVTPAENYADVRIGYTNDELYIHVAVFDRNLWYAPNSADIDLTGWDAVSLFVDTGGGLENRPAATSYRFISQLNWSEPRSNYQAAYQGDGSTWKEATLQFSTETGWRGNAPNDDSQNDRGWRVTYHIPFDSLGLGGPPAIGTVWGLALTLHDRDTVSGSPLPVKNWPPGMTPDNPKTWGQMSFGLPQFKVPDLEPAGSTIIRHQLNGAEVIDAMVGGGLNCGADLGWTTWGEANYAGGHQINIQNQLDVADWPCFSKFYVTFPLTSIPAQSTVISATLTLHQFGNAGEGASGEPPLSVIQAFTTGTDWDENTLTWNNAPLATENMSRAWVEPVDQFPGWPGVPWTWDVSKAVSQAHDSRDPLRLALYSADGAYHSGKYFVSSDTEDWNAAARPTLKVEWGSP